jgi:tRNA/rRNA methyltransferase
MNLGQAVAVCLYELARRLEKPSLQKRSTPAELSLPASAAQLERMTGLLFDALSTSGYLGTRPAASAKDKLRRQVRRLDLSAADAELWIGMLRQIIWKMRSESKMRSEGKTRSEWKTRSEDPRER